MRFISYLRVSTDKQGRSGLGLEAQRAAVASYLASVGGHASSEFVEVESGRLAERPQLARALAAARLHRLPLVVAKVDRLTRSLAFLSRLLESGVDVRFADLPQIEGATGRFLLQQMASVAELEAGMISSRTKAALAAAKARGVKLGGDRGGRGSPAGRIAAATAKRANADERAADIRPTVREIEDEGVTSLRGIARELQARGIPKPRGGLQWTPTDIGRLVRRDAK